MSEFGGMSIQERIRAMNKTIDKVGALPANTEPVSSIPVSTPAAVSNKHVEEEDDVVDDDYAEPQGPRRTSVVDMWRKREVTGPEAKPSPGPRKKSVLEKWSTAQQRSVAQEKVAAEVAQEEKKENDSPPKLSVTEMIAQKSLQQHHHPVASPPVMVKSATPAAATPQPKMSVADMIAQRASTLGSAPPSAARKSNPPTAFTPTKTASAELMAKRADFLAKRTPLVSTEPKPLPLEEDENSVSVKSYREIEGKGSATSDEVEQDVDGSNEHMTQRQSVADIWKSRMAPTAQTPVKKSDYTPVKATSANRNSTTDSKIASSSPLVETKPFSVDRLKPTAARTTTQPVSKFSSPSPAKDAKPVWARTVLNRTESPATTTMASPPASVKPSWVSESPIASRNSIEPRSIESKQPSWARKPVMDSASDDSKNADSNKPTEPEIATVFSPVKTSATPIADRTKTLGSPVPANGLKSVDSKPSWAKKSSITPQASLTAGPSKPSAVSSPFTKNDVDSSKSWAKKSPILGAAPMTIESRPVWSAKSTNRTASPSSNASPSIGAKPAWAVASLRKTGLRVGTDDEQTIQSAPAESASTSTVKENRWNKTGTSVKNIDETKADGELAKDLVKKFESVSMEVTSPKRRNPNRIKVDIDMSSKDCVDSDVVSGEESATEHDQQIVMQESGVATSENALADADVASTRSSQLLSCGSKSIHEPSIVDWPAVSEPEAPLVETETHTSPLQKQEKVRSPKVSQAPAAKEFWNNETLRSKPIPSAKNPSTPSSIDKTKSQPARATSPLIELAMQYRQSPNRESSSVTKAKGIRASISSGIESATRFAGKYRSTSSTNKQEPSVSKSTSVAMATPPRVVRRRNRVAQKHLSNKHLQSVSSNASSDVESVADSKKENETPISMQIVDRSSWEHEDEPGRIVPKSPVLSPTRLSENKERDTLSPNSSRLSRPDEKKEIQKRRNRMKGKDDDRSVFSTDSQSVVSQGSSFVAPSKFIDPPTKPVGATITPVNMNLYGDRSVDSFHYSSVTTLESNDAAVGRTLTISKISAFDDEISKVTDDEVKISTIEGIGGDIQLAPSVEHNYIPDALSPRTFKANLSSRMRHKKGQSAAQGTRSEVGVSDAWGLLTTGEVSSSSETRSVVSSTSGGSALAERASKVLQRRRGGKLGESPKRQLEVKVDNPVFPFPASDALVSRDHSGIDGHSRAVAATPPEPTRPSSTKSTSGKTAKKTKRSTIDRSGFVNRYKSSDRFMDSTGNEPHAGLTPRMAQDQPLQNFSYASEISTTSSPVAASSDDGSEPYIKRRSASMKSDSTAGPLGIDHHFRHQSASNMFAMQNAYKSVTATDLAFDLKEELAGTLTGSFEAMKNLANEFGKLAGTPSTNCQTASCRKGYKPSPTPLESCRTDEEDVAIEVEYIGDDEFPMDEDDFFDKQAQELAANHRVPAGQSSSEFYM